MVITSTKQYYLQFFNNTVSQHCETKISVHALPDYFIANFLDSFMREFTVIDPLEGKGNYQSYHSFIWIILE